jgi:hypothetical protein
VPGQGRGGDGGNLRVPIARQSGGGRAGAGVGGSSRGAGRAHGADVFVIAMISSSRASGDRAPW